VYSGHRVFWLIYPAGAQTDPASPGCGGDFTALPSPRALESSRGISGRLWAGGASGGGWKPPGVVSQMMWKGRGEEQMERAAKKDAEESQEHERGWKSIADPERKLWCPWGPEQGKRGASSNQPGDLLVETSAEQSPATPTHGEMTQLLRRCCPGGRWPEPSVSLAPTPMAWLWPGEQTPMSSSPSCLRCLPRLAVRSLGQGRSLAVGSALHTCLMLIIQQV